MPIEALETGLYNKLKADSSLTTLLGGTLIYNRRAPQNPGTAYVVFQWQGGGDENLQPSRSRNVLYTVKAVCDTAEKAAAVDSAIDTALHNTTLTVSGWTNINVVRTDDVNFVESTGVETAYYHAGGIYQIQIDA